MPKVSIILPVYNVEKYLKQCLDSILSQTFTDFECICVNDGSTDNSLVILQEYANKDNRIKIISQENKGQSSARNIGMNFSKGKYISFIDSDDWINNSYLEILYNIIEKLQYDIAICNYQFYYSKDDKYVPYIQNIIIDEKTTNLDKFCCCYTCGSVNTKLYKREFLESNNMCFLANVVMEDYIFSIITCLSTKKIISTKDSLYYYRTQIKSTMSNSDNVTISKFYNNFYLIRELRKRNISSLEIENFFVRIFFHNLSDICKRVKRSNSSIEVLYNKSLEILYFFNAIKKNLYLKYQIAIPITIGLFLVFKTKIFLFRNLFKLVH